MHKPSLYYFKSGEGEVGGGGGEYVGVDGLPVVGCGDLNKLLTFAALSRASDFHAEHRGLYEGRILRLEFRRF